MQSLHFFFIYTYVSAAIHVSAAICTCSAETKEGHSLKLVFIFNEEEKLVKNEYINSLQNLEREMDEKFNENQVKKLFMNVSLIKIYLKLLTKSSILVLESFFILIFHSRI